MSSSRSDGKSSRSRSGCVIEWGNDVWWLRSARFLSATWSVISFRYRKLDFYDICKIPPDAAYRGTGGQIGCVSECRQPQRNVLSYMKTNTKELRKKNLACLRKQLKKTKKNEETSVSKEKYLKLTQNPRERENIRNIKSRNTGKFCFVYFNAATTFYVGLTCYYTITNVQS